MEQQIRCVLFVVSKTPCINALELNAIAQDHFEVHLMSDVDLAIQWAESPYVSAWIVDASVGDKDAAKLFERLEAKRAGIPFIYIANQGELLTGFGTVLPNSILRAPVDYPDLIERLHELWRRDLFETSIVEVAVGSFNDTVAEFVPQVQPHDLKLRAGHLPVHSINAEIAFCGCSVTGMVSVSANPSTFRAIRKSILPNSKEASDRALEDLAGEMVNRFLGGLKRALLIGGVELSMGVPKTYSNGLNPDAYVGSSASLLLQIRSGEAAFEELIIGFTLKSLRTTFAIVAPEEATDDADNEEEDVAAGVLAFL